MNKQKILITILTVVLTGTMFFTVSNVYAQTSGTNTHTNIFQDFIQYLSQKFGIDNTKVQSAFTDFQQQRKAAITPRPTLTQQQSNDKEKIRLDQLVKDVKITSDQETAIINELSALRVKYNFESLKNLTLEERKIQMETMRNEIVSWSQSHGIDSSYVSTGFCFGNREMFGTGKGFGGRFGKIIPTPTQ